MLGVGQCALSPFSAAAVFPRILRSPALLALRVLLPLLLIQLDRFHHGLLGMAELRDVSRYRGAVSASWVMPYINSPAGLKLSRHAPLPYAPLVPYGTL